MKQVFFFYSIAFLQSSGCVVVQLQSKRDMFFKNEKTLSAGAILLVGSNSTSTSTEKIYLAPYF